MWTRFLISAALVAHSTPGHADDNNVINIADAITAYRLSAQYCHWPIPSDLDAVLDSDENHFKMKDAKAFARGVKVGAERFRFLTTSQIDYCGEVKESRERMTEDLKSRAK